jgi:hypothetical protein
MVQDEDRIIGNSKILINFPQRIYEQNKYFQNPG